MAHTLTVGHISVCGMVLHNNKWDRRAKKKYLKKHNLPVGPATQPEQPPAPPAESSGSESESEPLRFENAAVTVENEFTEDIEHEKEMQELRELQLRTRSVPAPPDLRTNDHIQTGTSDMFERAQQGAARSQLNQRVNQISKKHAKIELDSDSEFEDFMDDLDDVPQSEAPKQSKPSRPPALSRQLNNDVLDQIIMK